MSEVLLYSWFVLPGLSCLVRLIRLLCLLWLFCLVWLFLIWLFF